MSHRSATAVALPVSYPALGDKPVQFPAHSSPRSHIEHLMRAAFPGCRSRAEMARLAGRALGYSQRQVEYWLDGTHRMSWDAYLQLAGIAGFEVILRARP